MAVITVRFYGSLKTFGERFSLDVEDTAEALRALFAQLPKLRQTIQQGYYKIRIGKQYIDNRYLEQGFFYKLKAGMTVHITPVIQGAKKAGLLQTIAGTVMVVVGVTATVFSLGALAPYSSQLIIGGIAMMAGGVAQMLTKTPTMGNGNGNSVEKKQSTAFGNLQNIVAQGQPVPLAYGRIRCGSMIISQGVETVDVDA